MSSLQNQKESKITNNVMFTFSFTQILYTINSKSSDCYNDNAIMNSKFDMHQLSFVVMQTIMYNLLNFKGSCLPLRWGLCAPFKGKIQLFSINEFKPMYLLAYV